MQAADDLLWAIFGAHLILNVISAVTAWLGRYSAALFGLTISTVGFAMAVAIAPRLADVSEASGLWAAKIAVPACVTTLIMLVVALRRARLSRLAATSPPAEPDYVAIGQAMVEQMDARVAERRAQPRRLFG